MKEGGHLEGYFIMNDLADGPVSINWSNGRSYQGEYGFGMMNGYGKLKIHNGEEFYGNFRDDKIHGQCTWIQSKKGTAYKGEWANGKKEGQGAQTFKNGTIFTGSFKNDLICGEGKAVDISGLVSTGVFNDKKAGHATVTNFKFEGHSDCTYEGDVEDFTCLHGKGKLVSNKITYEGEFTYNRFKGKGLILIETKSNDENSSSRISEIKGIFEGFKLV